MTPFSIMFSRTGTNENCAEFVSYHFVPINQDGRKMLVKRMHLIENTSDDNVNHPASISDEMINAVLKLR